MTGARLFLPQWTDVVCALHHLEPQNRYYQRLIRNTVTSASYAREVLRSLEDQGFLQINRSGHIHRIVFTSLGNQLAFHLTEVLRLIDYSQGSGQSTSKDPLGSRSRLQRNL